MQAATTNLFLLPDLEDSSRTSRLTDGDLNALRTVADWIKTFVASPNKNLGRAGPVCPFVPGALERKTLWLAPEHLSDRSVPDVAELMNDYKRLLLQAQPIDGDDANYKALVVVLTDLSAARARHYLDNVQIQNLKRLSYVEDGVVFGDFHARNEGAAIRNPSFRPFKAPVPFLLMRHAVISDWMFSWTTKTGSALGRVALASPHFVPLLSTYASRSPKQPLRMAALWQPAV